jgi:transposase-like protein
MGTFGPVTVHVPRARLETSDGKTGEWKNRTIPAYQRRTKKADALIAGAYLAGTNTRRVRRALAALFGGAVGKDTVSRVWRKVKGDWDAWNARSLKDEPIIRLTLDGTAVRVRLDKKSTSISLLVALGVRQDGQKVLLAVKNMGGESEAAWRTLLDDLVNRGLKTPDSSSSMARLASKKLLPRSGATCQSSAVRCISTEIFSPMRPTGCTKKSPPITMI